jgi:fucose permease
MLNNDVRVYGVPARCYRPRPMTRSSGPRLVIALAFVAFVSLGLPDGVLGVAWPSVRATFNRPLSHLGVLLACGTGGYLLSSFLGGQFVRAVGVGTLLLGSSLLVAVSLAGISLAPTWAMMVGFAVVGGLGGGAIDAGINTFAASRFSARVVNWLHACWGIGASTGPVLMTAVLARGMSWRVGYEVLGVVLALLSLLFLFTLRMWAIAPATGAAAHEQHTASIAEALRRPVVWMQLALFFLYCGVESTAGQLLYTLFTESRGMRTTTAGLATGGYWASLTAGRIVFGQLAASMSRRTVLRIGHGLAPLAAALLWVNAGDSISVAAAALLGFALAPIFPTLISVTPDRVGHYFAPQAVGFQVAAANIGIATLPGLVALAARRAGLETVCAFLFGGSVLLLLMQEVVMRARRPEQSANAAHPCPLP